jgi:hypothetical protein
MRLEEVAAVKRAMKIFNQSDKERSERRALLAVVAVLTVAMLAKLGTVSLIFHLAH